VWFLLSQALLYSSWLYVAVAALLLATAGLLIAIWIQLLKRTNTKSQNHHQVQTRHGVGGRKFLSCMADSDL
jgi:hypothetical protein